VSARRCREILTPPRIPRAVPPPGRVPPWATFTCPSASARRPDIRPAALHGINPRWGLVSGEGLRTPSLRLDAVGWYPAAAPSTWRWWPGYSVFRRPPHHTAWVRRACVSTCGTARSDPSSSRRVQILMLAAGRLLGAGATVQELILPEPFNQLRDAHTDSNRGALVVPAGIPVGVRDPRPRPAG
jgi:hypothetical protein